MQIYSQGVYSPKIDEGRLTMSDRDRDFWLLMGLWWLWAADEEEQEEKSVKRRKIMRLRGTAGLKTVS